jgi:hypothetical protein
VYLSTEAGPFTTEEPDQLFAPVGEKRHQELLSIKEEYEIETKLDNVLGTIQCFLDPTCKQDSSR